MTYSEARDAILSHLRQKGLAGHTTLWVIANGDLQLVERLRADLILAEVAQDANGGLRYVGPQDNLGPNQLAVIHCGDQVTSVAFSPDGRCIASGSYSNVVDLWDPRSRRHLNALTGHEREVWSVAFSPDGKRIASGSIDRTIRLWDLQSGVCLHVLRGHKNTVSSVTFSPGGQHVLSGSYDNTVRLWDSQTGDQIAIMGTQEDWVESVVCSPDGRLLLSGSNDGTIRLWNLKAGSGMYCTRMRDP